MLFKKMVLIGSLFIFPTLTYADITIFNNTNYYGTAYTNFSPCSNKFGVIVGPKEPYTVPQSALDFFCLFGCDVHVFLSKDCSGPEFAMVKVNAKGITNIENHDREHFDISGNSTYVTINAKSGLLKWFGFRI